MMEINEGNTTDDLWTPYKELVSVVESYLTHESGGALYAVHTFESVLRRHKQTFLALFKNPPKNLASREELKRGMTEGITLPSIGRTIISKELVDEAIIISDMFNVNEYLALELLHTAQRQLPRHPGLPRGLVAVLLYYDGRRALVQALKELCMAREGVCWSISARAEVVWYVSRYVEQACSGGLGAGVLDALPRCDVRATLDLLHAHRAAPPHPHLARLCATLNDTRKLLASVLFTLSAQRGLERDLLLRILSEQSTSPSLGPTGALDEVSLALHMALLYALDLSVLHRREDGEELAKKLPLIQDPELISVLVEELSPQQPAAGGARALCQLALGLALAALKRAPAPHCPAPDLLDHDETLVDAAIDAKVFEYLDEAILSTDYVAKEEYYQRRIHSLITDFIVLMHSKLMEMRVKADEAARSVQAYALEGLAAPGGSRTRLDALLRCVRRLYARDPHRLRDDYWQPCRPAHQPRWGGRAASLYKFVRGAASSAALQAMASLAVCTHTWALLSRRDALSAHHMLLALARYHSNLRTDHAPFSDALHSSSLGATAIVTPAARPGKLLIRQEEVEAMIAALQLLAGVAREDQAAAAAICENLQWDAVNNMFGLMCCHIPLQLKAELCLTLAALGGWPCTAPRLWAGLEAARLVSLTNDKRALNAELQEVECRIEEYPLSRAFLSLLQSLSAAPPPRTLAAGVEPYVQHALLRLALPAPHRPYARPHEKWQILSQCFRLFGTWLEQYTPSPADFPSAGGDAECPAPPGFRILLQLHTKSELLRLLLSSLDQTYELLEKQPGSANEYVEQCLISVLEMLERALALERELGAAALEAGKSVIIIGLSKLILESESAESGCRLLACCRVAGLAGAAPLPASRAVQLLCRAVLQPPAARHVLAAATRTPALAAQIRHGFVECLEAEEWMSGGGGEDAALRRAKEGVLSLLHHVLPAAPPNFAHFLLGYQLTEDISRSAIHEPGVAGFPRTCLHSILDLLDQHIAGHSPNREATDLVESCYRLVYRLCARPNTSAPTLRFLRSRDYFLCRHVKHNVDLKSASPVTVSARSWVLRACACAAGAAAGAGQHAALAALLAALTGRSAAAAPPAQDWEWCLLRRTLEELPVAVQEVREPRWELFHAQQLRQAIASCDLPTGGGGRRVSVSRVHALLARELAALNATAPQRNLVKLEIQKVLDYVTEVNRQRNLAATLTHYYDSWRQLTEMLFCVAPHDILNLEARKNLLLNILQDLLNKIPPDEVLPQLGNLASGTVLLLMVNLRHCYILQKRESNLASSEFETSFFGPSNQIMQTNSLTLKFILNKILSWILVSGGASQNMRVNLYGALLNYLNIVNLKPSPAEPEQELNDTYVSRLDSSKAKEKSEDSSLKAMVVDVISEFGENLCAIVCGDCISAGQDVCRMVALACLETLIEINPRTDWMNVLINQGYLRSLIDSLLQDDEGLKEALEPNPKSLRVLYVYESKMALLIKMAGTRVGAETLLSQGALSTVANLQALDCHPDVHTGYEQHPDTDFIPSVAKRFRQMLVPALSLSSALLSALGARNHSCVVLVMHALLAHRNTVELVLRAAHPSSSPGLLVEVEAVTSVVSRASSRDLLEQLPAAAALRPLMLQLLTRFHTHQLRPDDDDDSQANLLYYKIVCNLLTYGRNMMSLDAGREAAAWGAAAPWGGAEPWGGVAACGCLLRLLQLGVTRVQHHDKLLATAHHQLHALPTMTLDEMQKLVPGESSARAARAGAARGGGRGGARAGGGGPAPAVGPRARLPAAGCARTLARAAGGGGGAARGGRR